MPRAIVGWRILATGLLIAAVGGVVTLFWLRNRSSRLGNVPTDSTEQMLRDTSWEQRAATAWGLTDRSDIPAGRRAVLLLEVLEREITSPSKGPTIAGSYLPLTSFLRLHYLHALETLGPDAREPVREVYKKSQGNVREWYGLALGATLAPDALPEIRGLLARSSDLAVRMTAARYLGWLKDRDAIPVLTAALRDTARATIVTDVVGRGPKRFHPVREQAARALRELGLRTKRRGDSTIVY